LEKLYRDFELQVRFPQITQTHTHTHKTRFEVLYAFALL